MNNQTNLSISTPTAAHAATGSPKADLPGPDSLQRYLDQIEYSFYRIMNERLPTVAPANSSPGTTPDSTSMLKRLFTSNVETTRMPRELLASPNVYFTPYMATLEFTNGASHSASPRLLGHDGGDALQSDIVAGPLLPLPLLSAYEPSQLGNMIDRPTQALPCIPRPGYTEPTSKNNLKEDNNPTAVDTSYTDHSSGNLLALRDRTIISSTMPPSEIIQLLLRGGCSNVTLDLNLDQCGTLPVAGGGFGDIYRGSFLSGLEVAIKCPRLFLRKDEQGNSIVKNIAREIYTWSKLKHHNVLELSGLAIFRDQISIVSPWMENGTLPEYIAKNPTIDRPELCAQISTGLAYLHTSGVVHGDIKGANVLISASGLPKLSDFGNAVLKKYTLQFTGGTTSLNVSMRWTAPELLTGGDCFTKEADVFGLGMIFFEVMTGKLPFHDKPEHVACALIIGGKTPGIPNDTKNVRESVNLLGHVMHQCWSFDAADRPSASQVEQQLREVDGSGPSDEAIC